MNEHDTPPRGRGPRGRAGPTTGQTETRTDEMGKGAASHIVSYY